MLSPAPQQQKAIQEPPAELNFGRPFGPRHQRDRLTPSPPSRRHHGQSW